MMNSSTIHLKCFRLFSVVLLLVVAGNACIFSANTPVIQTIQVTQVVTQLVTRDVTEEKTLLIEIPVTVTPSDTPLYTFTPSLTPTSTSTPTITPIPEPPVVAILENSDCLYGPGSAYLYKYNVLTSALMEVIGRNMDESWLYIQNVHGWNPCWIQAALVEFRTGDIGSVPFTYSTLPYSNQYRSPEATAHRDGIDVTISWKAVWMSLDDYRGYLIEAWVCQTGTQVFVPMSYVPSLASNTGALTVKVTDEPGCNAPSSARIYSVEKHGYSEGANIPWPAYPVTPTPDNN